MKLVALLIAVQNPVTKEVLILTREYDVSDVGYMMRGSMKDTCKFIARESLKGLERNSRNSVEHEGFLCHVQRHSQPVAAYAFVDKEYPVRIAYSLLQNVLSAFFEKVGDGWKEIKEDNDIKIPKITQMFKDYQTPSKVDKLTLAQEKIDETKIILHDNIKKLLQRQGDLDALVDKSKDLSLGAKQFYKTSKDMNKSCCSLI